MSFDKTIQMYIFDGNPNGRIMCELSNWNGRVYKISRNELSEFSKRADAENTGMYFLLGKNESNDTVYIGEAEKALTRLKQHLKDEEYWNDCIVIISKDNLLNKAHVKYLENKFFHLADEANRYRIVNSTVPTCSSISEYDIAMLEEFISNSMLLVNALGYKTFETVKNFYAIKDESITHEFYIKATRGANAKGMLVADGFAVLKGSIVAGTTVPSFGDSLEKLRNNLIENGTIDSNFAFQKDYVFSSPSYAAAVVMGRSANGKVEWKTINGKNLNDIEQEESNI